MIRRITLSRKLCTAVVLSIAGAIISGCGVSKSQFNPERKFSAGQLIEDFDIAWKTYKKNHPSYNWYGPEDSVNAVFEKVRASITDSLTEAEFRLRLSYAVAAIRCGHTTVSSSKAYSKFFKNSKTPQFPLSVKVWGNDSMVVLQNISKDTSNIKKGTIVTTIDSIGTSVFIRQMKEYISTDGFSDGFKELQISAAFGARFKWMYGLKNSYNIGYINEKGKDTSSVLPVYFPAKKDSLIKKDTSRRNQLNTNLKRPSYGFLKTDTSQKIAVFELNNFSHPKVPSFIRKSFKTLYKQKISNLIIDLRMNGGGKVENSTLLTRYLINKPFRMADSVSAKNLVPAYPKYTQHGWVFKYFHWTFAKKQADGRFHMQSAERVMHKPKKRYHFKGQVYALTGGFTFSASTLFLSKIMEQPNVTIIGEETGGGARGNSAVFTPYVTLPNSKVRIRLPLFRIITDVDIPQNGKGILPDYHVTPGSESIRLGSDRKMQKAYELILKSEEKK